MAEKELGIFLEENYYPKTDFNSFQKCTTDDDQYAGIDVKAKKNNEILLIDEKGLLSIPKPINTFALELAYQISGISKIGWLLDKNKKTTDYLFCWVKRDDVDIADFRKENIHYVLAMLVNREALLKYLENRYEINEKFANDVARRIIQQGVGGRLEYLSSESSSRYHYSNQLPEKPVNIILNKKDFEDSAAAISFHLVKRSGITQANFQ